MLSFTDHRLTGSIRPLAALRPICEVISLSRWQSATVPKPMAVIASNSVIKLKRVKINQVTFDLIPTKVHEVVMLVKVVNFQPPSNHCTGQIVFDACAVIPWQIVSSALIPKIAVKRRAALLWLVVRWAATKTSHAHQITARKITTCTWIA